MATISRKESLEMKVKKEHAALVPLAAKVKRDLHVLPERPTTKATTIKVDPLAFLLPQAGRGMF